MAQNTDLSFVVNLSNDKFVNLYDLSASDSSKFFITVNGKYGATGTDFSCNFWPHTYSSHKIETLKRETHALVDSSFVYSTSVKDISFDMSFNSGQVERTASFTVKQGDDGVSCLPVTTASHELLDLYFYNLFDVSGQMYQRVKAGSIPIYDKIQTNTNTGTVKLWSFETASNGASYTPPHNTNPAPRYFPPNSTNFKPIIEINVSNMNPSGKFKKITEIGIWTHQGNEHGDWHVTFLSSPLSGNDSTVYSTLVNTHLSKTYTEQIGSIKNTSDISAYKTNVLKNFTSEACKYVYVWRKSSSTNGAGGYFRGMFIAYKYP